MFNIAHVFSSNGLSVFNFGFLALGGIFLTLLIFVVITLKGYVLWTAARRGEKGWFIALLIINTMGILELIYLYFIVKKWDKPKA